MRITGVIALIFFFLSQTSFADDADAIRVIVKYKARPAGLKYLSNQIGKTAKLPIQSLKPMAGGAYVITFTGQTHKTALKPGDDQTDNVLKRLKADPNVLYAVKDRKGQFKPLPKGAAVRKKPRIIHEAQWDEFKRPGGVMLESDANKYDGAWGYSTGLSTPPTVVAVLDTGIAPHESLDKNLLKDKNGNIWGWNFFDNNNDLSDETESYHGTHVSGTIAGYGQTIKGMGEDLKILIAKIPGASGMFYESSVINAILWSVGEHVPGIPDNPYPAKVLNMSFGVDERPGKEIDYCDAALQEALTVARSKGAVIVVAAGNDDHWEHLNAPAVCNGTIKVAATGPKGTRAYYSNYGPSITFAAPGGDLSEGNLEDGILSTVNPGGGYARSGYDFYQGTSMASPHVAGVAGLLFAASNGQLSPEQVEKILYLTTHEFGESDYDDDSCVGSKPCGHGILDAENAVKATIANYDVLFSAPDALPLWGASIVPGDYWIPTHTNHKPSKPSLSWLEKDSEGKILAYAGGKAYQLNDQLFSRCEIIGFDGIGCYF